MAANVVKGATVTFTFNSKTLKIASLSVSTGQGLFDVSAFGSGSYVDRIGGGLKDLAGSAAGFLQAGVSAANPFDLVDSQSGDMVITYDTGCTVTFKALVGGVNIDVTRAGVGVVRFDWSKADDSDPTIAWS